MAKRVSISGLLAPERIAVDLKAKDYKSAVDQLLDRLEAAALITDRAAIDELVDAEIAAGDLPSIGGRAVLAHYRTDAVRELALALGTSRTPFAFAPATASEARFLVLILAPRSAAKYYLKTVAALSRLLQNDEAAAGIADSRSAEELLNVVSRQDVVIRPELLVQDLMSREVQSVSPETLLSEALRVMVRHGRRALPVVGDRGEVLGLVTEQELIQQFLPQMLGTATLGSGERPRLEDAEVRDVMRRSVMCLSEDQLISDVLGTILTKEVPQFPVVEGGRLVGFLSRTDLIRKLLRHSI